MADNVLMNSGEAARDQLDGLPEGDEAATLPTASGSHEPSETHHEDDGNQFQKAIAAWRSEYASHLWRAG